MPDDEEPVVLDSWIGACETCGATHYVEQGWAAYWPSTGELKDWHGFGPDGETCQLCTEDAYPRRGPATVRPLPRLDDQLPFRAAKALGGVVAVDALVDYSWRKRLRQRPVRP